MTDDNKTADRVKRAIDASMMSTDRPLDSLLPELRSQAPRVDKAAFHPRVLEVEREAGYSWVCALWSDPGEPQQVHDEARKLIEATMLAELSRIPASGDALARVRSSLRLEAFDTVEGGLDTPLRAFGLRLAKEPLSSDLLSVLIEEGRAMGWDIPDKPVSSWEARMDSSARLSGEDSVELQREMSEAMGADVWGKTPGGPSRLAANLLKEKFGREITPTPDGLRELERLLVDRTTPGVIRWIHPLPFQALCDFIGVVISHHFGLGVEWAECQPDEGDYAPPPVFRIRAADGGFLHLPVAMHLLRWCIMPILPGDEIPSLAEWLEFEFGSGAH